MPAPFTPKRIALGHVAYEVSMCAETAARVYLYSHDATLADGVAKNACLESMLLHVRNLDDFLNTTTRKFKSDLIAVEFTPSWKPSPEDAAQRLLDRRSIINQHLSHLTWERATNTGPPPWPIVEMARDVLCIAADWIEHYVLEEGIQPGDLRLWDGSEVRDSVRKAKAVLGMQ